MSEGQGRVAPTPPPPAEWAAGCADYDAGRVIQLTLPSPAGELDVNITVTFLEQWRRVSLSVSERRAIRTALAQIHSNRVHPCLGKRQMPNDRLEPAWMASPCPDVTITWTGMWSDPAIPVLLTLTSLADPES